MKNKYFSVFCVIILLFVLGCTIATQAPDPLKNLQKFTVGAPEYPNKPVPSFTLTDDKGNTLTNDNLKGKTYMIQGFAPGCSSCAREIATLKNLYEKYQNKGLEVISLDILSEDINGALDTKEQFQGGDWHWTVDLDNVAVKFGMRTLESTYIIDKEGIIRYKDEIISDSDILSQEIEKLI